MTLLGRTTVGRTAAWDFIFVTMFTSRTNRWVLSPHRRLQGSFRFLLAWCRAKGNKTFFHSWKEKQVDRSAAKEKERKKERKRGAFLFSSFFFLFTFGLVLRWWRQWQWQSPFSFWCRSTASHSAAGWCGRALRYADANCGRWDWLLCCCCCCCGQCPSPFSSSS